MPISSVQQHQYLLGRYLQKEGQYLEVKMSDFHAEIAREDYVIVQTIIRWDNQSCDVTAGPMMAQPWRQPGAPSLHSHSIETIISFHCQPIK
jgi:hypothetical protein